MRVKLAHLIQSKKHPLEVLTIKHNYPQRLKAALGIVYSGGGIISPSDLLGMP